MHPLNPCPPDREIGVLPDHSKVGANCLLARTQSTLLLCTRPFQGGPVHERSTLPCEIRANQAVGLPPDWNGLRVLGEAGSQAFFRVDTFRVRRSGSRQGVKLFFVLMHLKSGAAVHANCLSTMMPLLHCHQPFPAWQSHPALSKSSGVDCKKASLPEPPSLVSV